MQRLGQYSSKRLSIRVMAYTITLVILGFSGIISGIIYHHLLSVAEQAEQARFSTIPLALKQHERAVDVRQLALYTNLIADSQDDNNRRAAQQNALQLKQSLHRDSPASDQETIDAIGIHLQNMLQHSHRLSQHQEALERSGQEADKLLLSINILLDAIIFEHRQASENSVKNTALDAMFTATRLQQTLMMLRRELATVYQYPIEQLESQRAYFMQLMQLAHSLARKLDALEYEQALMVLFEDFQALERLYTTKTAMREERLSLNAEARLINGLLATLSSTISRSANELANRGADKVAANARQALTIAMSGFGILALVFVLTLLAVRYEIIRPIILAGFSLQTLSTGKPKVRLAKTDLREIDAINSTIRNFARALEEKENANERLLAMAQMKAAFTSSVSHELRTPLTSIRGFIKLVYRDFERFFAGTSNDSTLQKKAQQITSNLEIVMKESERLSLLIDDVLDIAKIESGRMTWRDSDTDVGEIILRAEAALAGEFLQRKDISLQTIISPHLPKIHLDADKLLQVLLNLLNNALKFTEKGTIIVEAHADKDAIHISIADTGQGIAEDDIDVIFEKFQQGRLPSLDAAKPKGTGLGLAICKQIIEHYGGRISVTSTLGQGSTFRFHLPLQQGNQHG